MANNIRIRATLDDKVTGPLGKIRDQFDRLGKNKGAAAVLQGIGVGAGLSAYNLLSQAMSTVVDVAKTSIAAASDLNETLTKSRVIFGDNADAMEKWADTAARAFGQSKRQALDTASQFANLFNNVGMEQQATSFSQTLTQLGSDLASFFNTDVDTALQSLRSGLSGESEPLRKFGVFLNESAVAAEAAAMGMKTVNGRLTDGQKVAARYSLILKQTSRAQGDFARTGDGYANSQRSLTAEIENLSAEIGTSLLPIVQELAVFLRDDVIPAASALGDALEWIGKNADWLSAVLGGAQGSVQRWADRAVDEAQRVSDEYYKSAGTWDTYSEKAALAGHLVGSATKTMASDIRTVGGRSREMADLVETSMQRVVDAATKSRDDLQKIGREAADAAFDPLIAAAELAVTKQELADVQRQLSAKDLTTAERNELRLRELELKKSLNQQTIDVRSFNGTTVKELDDTAAQLKKLWQDAGAEARQQIALNIRQLNLMRIAALEAWGSLENNGDRTSAGPSTTVVRDELGDVVSTTYTPGYSGKRALGGPVDRGRQYRVGEAGAELFLPGRTSESAGALRDALASVMPSRVDTAAGTPTPLPPLPAPFPTGDLVGALSGVLGRTNDQAPAPALVGMAGPQPFVPEVPGTIVPHDELVQLIAQTFGGFRATGGPVEQGQAYVVGEQGPEVFVAGRSGRIVPNDRLTESRSETVIHTHVNLDGRQIAEIVDRHLAGSMRHIPALARNAAAV